MYLKGMNETMGPDGLVPTLLLFCMLTNIPTETYQLLFQRLRVAALRTVKDEMSTIVASQRIVRRSHETFLRRRGISSHPEITCEFLGKEA